MKKSFALVAATLLAVSPALAVEPDTGKATTTEGTETSDRTPDKTTTTPLSQVDTTESGETSTRSDTTKTDCPDKMAPESSN